jgi:hypothetical protein
VIEEQIARWTTQSRQLVGFTRENASSQESLAAQNPLAPTRSIAHLIAAIVRTANKIGERRTPPQRASLANSVFFVLYKNKIGQRPVFLRRSSNDLDASPLECGHPFVARICDDIRGADRQWTCDRHHHRPNRRAPISNVAITVVGTTLGARSGADGKFTINEVPAGAQRLRAARIGYSPADQLVNLTPDRRPPSTLRCPLRPSRSTRWW